MESDKVEELRMLYQVTTQDLVFFKQQQWSVAYYALLLYAGIFGIGQIDKSVIIRFILATITTIIAVFGIIIIWDLENSIK